MEKISFHPLESHHLEQLTVWLNLPHVREHFQTEPIDYLAVVGRYTPRILGLVATDCYLAQTPDGRTLAFLERTLVTDDFAWQRALDLDPRDRPQLSSEDWSIGIFIVEPDYLGMGTGSHILRSFIQLNPANYWIAHGQDNPRALAASRKAGFTDEHFYSLDGYPKVRLHCKRKEG